MLIDLPSVNRAQLDGRTWLRTTGHILVPVRIGEDDLRGVVMEPWRRPPSQVIPELTSAIRANVKAKRRFPELVEVGTQLGIEWARVGPIHSVAGALVSLVADDDGIDDGLNALPPGIVAAVCVNRIVEGRVTLGVQIDHRALDREHITLAHEYLRKEVARCLDAQS